MTHIVSINRWSTPCPHPAQPAAATQSARFVRFTRRDPFGTVAINPAFVVSVSDDRDGGVRVDVVDGSWLIRGTLDEVLAALNGTATPSAPAAALDGGMRAPLHSAISLAPADPLGPLPSSKLLRRHRKARGSRTYAPNGKRECARRMRQASRLRGALDPRAVRRVRACRSPTRPLAPPPHRTPHGPVPRPRHVAPHGPALHRQGPRCPRGAPRGLDGVLRGAAGREDRGMNRDRLIRLAALLDQVEADGRRFPW